MNASGIRIIGGWVLAAGFALLLTGCQTMHHGAMCRLGTAMQNGYQSVLMIRVIYSQGTNVTGGRFTSIESEMEKDSPVNFIESGNWRIPSSAAGKAGWYFLEFEPGSHYLEIEPNHKKAMLDRKSPNSLVPYYVYLPVGRQVAYGGTFIFVREKKTHGWGHVFESRGVTNELAEARRVAGESMSPLGEVIPGCAVPYDQWPAMPDQAAGRTQFEADADLTLNAPAIYSPGTVWLAGPMFVSGSAMFQVGLNSSQSKAGADIAGAGLVLVASSLLFWEIGDQTFGRAERKKWAPYGAAQANEFYDFNFTQRLVNETSNRFTAFSTSANHSTQPDAKTGIIVQIQPYRVYLNETRAGKFALEVAVRVSILDQNTKRPLWTHGYVYTNHNGAMLPEFYETLLHAQSEPHPLKDYECDSGPQLFRNELTKAVTAISTEIATQMHGSNLAD
jgi:hypothetical protein